MNCSTPGLLVHHQLPESTQTMSIESVMPSNHLILCRPLLLPPSVFPSIRVFSNESVLLIRWPKYWSFSFSISPSNEHPVLISFRMDWLDLLAVQGTLKSLLQHHSSKASILQCSAFFTVQLSHTYMFTGETIALTRRTFVGKVMSLLFNMPSRFVITFLPRSKHLLISWHSFLSWHLEFWQEEARYFKEWYLQSGPTSLSLCINIKWHFLSKKKKKTISIPFYSFSLLPLSLSLFLLFPLPFSFWGVSFSIHGLFFSLSSVDYESLPTVFFCMFNLS